MYLRQWYRRNRATASSSHTVAVDVALFEFPCCLRHGVDFASVVVPVPATLRVTNRHCHRVAHQCRMLVHIHLNILYAAVTRCPSIVSQCGQGV